MLANTAALLSFAAGASAMEILAMGDWGGQSAAPFTTSDERATAKSMKEQKATFNVSLSLALGDNFYDNGVKNAQDSRFQETFEKVFDPTLDNFRVLAGNHDYNGNVTAEVEYTTISKRWNFPSLYYTWNEALDNGAVLQFVFLDTCILSGVPPHGRDEMCILDPEACRVASLGSSLNGTYIDQQATDDQWTWAQTTLAASTADFLVVSGHYPVWSIAEHGPTAALVSKLEPMLKQYEATAYLCGHDHSGQHLRDPADAAMVDYHVIGAAHLVDSSTKHIHAVPKNSLQWHSGDAMTGGMYARISVNSTSFIVHHYGNDGKLLYSSPTKGPRAKHTE